ncbi:hypothetical protein DAI22_05g141800 [Oryza sativa Japonica Group]|nr:hypothetical protein DAI22_05g141800 [Oryza sativa Japonica Group]
MDRQEEDDDAALREAGGGASFPGGWLRRLSRELRWSFVLAVVAVYGACQGVGDAVGGVTAGYYWKDVQRVQPSAAQFYQGFVSAPWVLGIMPAILALTAQSAGAAVADVTVDALVAQNSITHQPLAADMQSLCGFSSSVGALLGFSISGLLVHSIGSQGALGLLSIPSALVFLAGVLLKERRVTDFDYKQVHRKFYKAIQSMGATLNLSLDIQAGMFYWYTDPIVGPGFSEEFIGLVYSVGSIGSLLGVLLYQISLKDYPFRGVLFWGQVLSSLAGMLNLIMVTRLNTRIGIPDYVFAVIDNSVSQMVGRLKWLPLLVLCSKLCPPGIEGTFYALLMSIQNAGLLMSGWWGGLMLHLLNVTRTEFSNLWVAVLIRNLSRLLPLMLLFLVPQSDQNSMLLPAEMLQDNESTEARKGGQDTAEFSVLVADDSSCHALNVAVEDERIKVVDAGTGTVELIPLMNELQDRGS